MTKIFYFSGTGNCYNVANRLSKKLHGSIECLADYVAAPYVVEDECIGIVTPVYSMDLPAITEEFLQRLALRKPKYIFVVATMGMMAGRTLAHARKILAARKYALTAGFAVTLPDNSIVFPSTEGLKKKYLGEEAVKVDAIAENVKNCFSNISTLNDSGIWRIFNAVGMWTLVTLLDAKNKKVDAGKCTGCGTCAKICPAHSIHMQNGKPHFDATCFTCFGCAHWCPQGAISLGRLHPGAKTRYVHPHIKVQEFAGQTVLKDWGDK
ncbi:MAG: EFR1 family ferrodoxin [Acidaminococcaceae bacterium]|nr:EFR1 family ferrodoxin [Acidaminococcaceae bacterium]